MGDTKKNLHANHRRRFRDRYDREGPLSFEEHELLELFLFEVIPRRNTNPTAHLLLNYFGSLHGVFTAPYEELIKVEGVGDKTARYIIDSYHEYCAEVNEKYMSMRMDCVERVSSYLLWHRSFASSNRGKDNYVSVLLLSKSFECIELYDVFPFNAENIKAHMDEIGAFQVILGVGADFDMSLIEGLQRPEDLLVDVLTIKDYSVKSMVYA